LSAGLGAGWAPGGVGDGVGGCAWPSAADTLSTAQADANRNRLDMILSVVIDAINISKPRLRARCANFSNPE
jgi:hypothetical protein